MPAPPAPPPTPDIRKDRRDSSIGLAYKATVKVEDEEEELRLQLEAIEMITERCVHSFCSCTTAPQFVSFRLRHGKTCPAETVDSSEFVYKVIWAARRDKQAGNLRINHGVSFC